MSFMGGKQASDLNLSFERMSGKDLKSPDQIRRHSIDSRLEGKTLERAVQIFTVGDEVQKLSVVGTLAELLSEDRAQILQTLVPKVMHGLSSASTEYQVTMATTVQSIIRDKVVTNQQFVDTFLPAILTNIDHKDQSVASIWTDTLVEAIQFLNVESLRQHVTNVAFQRTHVIRPAPVRASSCAIIGELAAKYDVAAIKKDVIPVVISLSQDLDIEVRVCLAKSLTKIIRALKGDAFKTPLGNTLLELAADEQVRVKDAAFRTICNVLDVVGSENVKGQILPVLKQMIHFGFKNDDSLLLAVSESYGKLCSGIDKVTTEKELFIKYYVTMAGMGIPPSRRKATSFAEPTFHIVHTSLNPEKYVLCRQAAATNFPVVCKFAEGLVSLVELLHMTLNELNTDSYYIVRRIVGQGLADICINLGKSAHLLKSNVLQLLLDDAEEVLEGFFPNLSLVIEGLIKVGVYKTDPPPKDTSVADLNKAVLRCENIICSSHNWRLYTTFLSQIECLYKFNQTDVQFNNYISLLLKRMHGTRTVPTRVSLMRTVLIFLRYLQKPSQRSEVRHRIINEFCQSNSFYNKIFYLRSCDLILEIFSTYYFKEFFFFRTMQLMDDPVPNVRWALLTMLPKLKQMLKQPSEKKMLALVDTAIAKFAEDKDKEIAKTFETIKATMDVTDSRWFVNDTKKYEEETRLLGGADSSGGAGSQQIPGSGSNVPSGFRRPPGGEQSRPNMPPPRNISRSPSVTPPSSPKPGPSPRNSSQTR